MRSRGGAPVARSRAHLPNRETQLDCLEEALGAAGILNGHQLQGSLDALRVRVVGEQLTDPCHVASELRGADCVDRGRLAHAVRRGHDALPLRHASTASTNRSVAPGIQYLARSTSTAACSIALPSACRSTIGWGAGLAASRSRIQLDDSR